MQWGLGPPDKVPCLRQGDQWVQKHDRSSLRVLGSVGEPINPRAWQWLFEARPCLPGGSRAGRGSFGDGPRAVHQHAGGFFREISSV